MNRVLRCIAFLSGLLLMAGPVFATGLGNAFTYQGSLNNGGLPATGIYDFQFAMYDAPSGGSQVGATLTFNGVNVTAGVFTVNLDFGQSFNDNACWLEISTRLSNNGVYTLLTPRQAVTEAPVAQFALNGGSWRKTASGAIYNANDDKPVLVNRSTQITGSEYFGVDSPTNSYGGMYLNTTGGSGKPFYGYATGGTSKAWSYVDGASGNWILNVGGTDRMTVASDGRVGIGSTPAAGRLKVVDSSSDAIYAEATGFGGRGLNAVSPSTAVQGISTGSGMGVLGIANDGKGVFGQTVNGYGVFGTNGGDNNPGYAGYFNGRVHIAGTLSKLSGSFRIDHPLDPAHKTLSHSFVESPDMMNLYNGNVTTDAEGRATITLPDWFEALNRDFRYQITPIGSFSRAMVEREIKDHTFVIRTEEPNVKVSWQVSGIRHDRYAADHPIIVEEEKTGAEKGKYLYPAGYAKDQSGSKDGGAKAASAASANDTKGGR